MEVELLCSTLKNSLIIKSASSALRGIFSGHDVTDLVAFNPFTVMPCFTGGCHSVTHRDEGAHRHTQARTYKDARHITASSHRSLAKPERCNCYSIVRALNSLLPSPTLSPRHPSLYPKSLLAGPTLFSWLSWRWLTKPSLLPISSETGAGTMTASSPTERGRGKRGPWELQADTLRAVQVSSSPGPTEKRRLICCPCFPREGGCRRKKEWGERMGVEGGQVGKRE